MTKDHWCRHIEEVTGFTRPSKGGSIETWKTAPQLHDFKSCPVCIARAKTKRRNKNARITREVMKSMGLNRVIGPVSGTIYYE